jgi:ABC-type enterochelin transport system permease subunit
VSGGGSASKRSLVIILAIIAVVAIVVGVLYFVGGSSLPSFMTAGSHVKKGNHDIRGAVALVIGVVAAVGAWWSNKKK